MYRNGSPKKKGETMLTDGGVGSGSSADRREISTIKYSEVEGDRGGGGGRVLEINDCLELDGKDGG